MEETKNIDDDRWKHLDTMSKKLTLLFIFGGEPDKWDELFKIKNAYFQFKEMTTEEEDRINRIIKATAERYEKNPAASKSWVMYVYATFRGSRGKFEHEEMAVRIALKELFTLKTTETCLK